MEAMSVSTRSDDVEGVAHEADHLFSVERNRIAVHKRIVGHRHPHELLVIDVGLSSLSYHCIEERVINHLV